MAPFRLSLFLALFACTLYARDEPRLTTANDPVRWDKRRYLISPDQMESFCNDVNMGLEPRNNLRGPFYLRVGDGRQNVTAKPSVPKAWEGFLLKAPLHAKVIKVHTDGRAQIDCGSERGVWKGMQLYAGTSSLLEVIEVEPKTSVVTVTMPRQGSIEHGQRVHSKDDLDE